jgi:diguanylate cyclase (GGDEF)-like protein
MAINVVPSPRDLHDLVTSALAANAAGETNTVETLLTQLQDRIAWGSPDPLTGCLRNEALPTVERRHPPTADDAMTVVYVDLDGLKAVNDRRGHRAGDGYIRKAAEVLQKASRSEDNIVIRRGGDEFLVLAPHSRNTTDSTTVALRIQQALNEARIPASVGHDRQRPGEILEQTIARADRAMYAMKVEHRQARGVAR